MQWIFVTSNILKSAAAIGVDGTIYVGSYDFKLYALSSSGSIKWNYTTGAFVETTPVIDGDGVLYFGSDDNYIYALYLRSKTFGHFEVEVFDGIFGAKQSHLGLRWSFVCGVRQFVHHNCLYRGA